MSDYKPVIPVKVRTARKEHTCGRCREPIEPGEQYEIHVAPPWTDGNESPHWFRVKDHKSEPGRPMIGCDLAAAYREKRARE